MVDEIPSMFKSIDLEVLDTDMHELVDDQHEKTTTEELNKLH